MSKEDLLEFAIREANNLQDLLKGFDSVNNLLKEYKAENTTCLDGGVEEAKKCVDRIFDQITNFKEEFYQQYEANKCNNENSNISENIENDVNKCVEEFKTNEDKTNGSEDSEIGNKDKEINKLSEIVTEDKTIVEQDDEKLKQIEENKTTVPNPLQNNNEDASEDEDVDKNTEDLKSTDSSDTGNVSVDEQEKEKNGVGKDNESDVEIKQEIRPLIKLVDLNKLIDPKPKKSVKFDSSVIILTSSDDESATSTPKKRDLKEQNGKLKSALKNSTSSKILEINLNEFKNKLTSKLKLKTTNKNDETYGGNSESSVEEDPLKETTEKLSYSISSESNDEDDKKHTDKEEAQEISQNSSNKRSSRIILKQKLSVERKKNLRKIFKRKDVKSNFEIVTKDSSDESEVESNKKRNRVKRDLLETHLSDTSSISSENVEEFEKIAKSDKENRKRRKYSAVGKNDTKFNSKVLISLPRIECEKLKNIYENKKDILEVKRLTKHDLNKKRSRPSGNSSNSSSDNSEKPLIKKNKNQNDEKPSNNSSESSSDDSKTPSKNINDEKPSNSTLNISSDNSDTPLKKIKKKSHEKPSDSDILGISSSDDEPNANSTTNESLNLIENSEDANTDLKDSECLAEIAMETLKNIENDNSFEESDNSENDNSKKKDDKSEPEEAEKSDDKKEKNKDNGKKTSIDNKKEKNKEDETEENSQEKKNESDISQKSNSDNSDDEEDDKKKKKWRKDKLIASKLDSTDSEEEFDKFRKKKEKIDEESTKDEEIKMPLKGKRKGRKRINALASDSDDSDAGKKEKNENITDSEDKSSEEKSNSSSSEEDKEDDQKKPTRRRIKRTKDSSSSDEDKSTRKQIRKVIGKDMLCDSTKQAEADEKERKNRIAEKQRKYNQIFEALPDSKVEKVVLDFDEKSQKQILGVHKHIVEKLKPHQASGIKFMWDACFESIERARKTPGSGCILAHCMGLGKTLQVIALSHALLTHSEKTKVNKIMVVCPLSTVLNWKAEFKKWLPKKDQFEVYELVSCKQNYERQFTVNEWHTEGGVLIIGYNMFRNLSNPDNKRISKKMRTSFLEGLVDPGPDLVVCDEGHLLKNEKTNLSIAMNRIKTLRRIVLTGTPLQNNLKEYWCMVQFIKPNLLGTYKEYLNRFVNPITNGQYTDSTQRDTILMRKRSHVLHKLLDGVVERRDYSVLEPYLPPKHEYVVFVQLSEVQTKIYRHYMEKFARQSTDGSNKSSFLFTDFQQFQRLCTHPRVLLDRTREKTIIDQDDDSEGSLKDFIDDGNCSSSSSSESSDSSGESKDSDNSDGKKPAAVRKKPKRGARMTRAQAAQKKDNSELSDSDVEEVQQVQKEWWQEYCDGDELDNIENSGKLFLLFQILKECEEIGDKILIFSQSLYTLNCIEYFLEKVDEATQNNDTKDVGFKGSWCIGLDYFRLDGSTSCDNRAAWCNMFNNPNNIRARLFLISTKAGGLGINLVAANRVIVFDVSWNPSHDIQSIYRVYRFGQTKPCYIYRFVSYGTMEMKIYERQVTKQAISKRVIDEQQIDRHYNQNDLMELYKCDLAPTDRPIPLVPKDVLLGELLQKHERVIYKYHLHQSLLENKTDEGLNEEERKAAWEEFENEKELRKSYGSAGFPSNTGVSSQLIAVALTSIVRKDNPMWSDVQIKGIIPALVQQLQVQLSEGDMTMYSRVQQEIQIMQAMQAQTLKEAYIKRQMMAMAQQAKMSGINMPGMNMPRMNMPRMNMPGLNMTPAQLMMNQAAFFNTFSAGNHMQGGSSSAHGSNRSASDVIELND